MGIIYYIYLLFIIIFLCILLKNSTKISTIKAIIYIEISFCLFFMRYITLLFFRISHGTRYLYVLKPAIFINNLGIICLSIMFIYVFFKKNNIDFKYNYCFALAFSGGYFTLIKYIVIKVIYDVNFGYIVNEMSNYDNVSFAYLLCLSVFLLISVMYFDKKNAETKNIIIFILIIAFTMLENILFICGIKIMPYVMVSDVPFLIFSSYLIKRLSKNNVIPND